MLRPSEAIVLALVAGAGMVSAVCDLRTRRIPNMLTIGIGGLGLLLAITGISGLDIRTALAGVALGFGLMLPGHLFGATGAGDVKLFAAIGALLGPSAVLMAFLYTAIAGGGLALIVSVQRRRFLATVERTTTLLRTAGANVAEIEGQGADNRFAYAPAIAIGTFVAALVG